MTKLYPSKRGGHPHRVVIVSGKRARAWSLPEHVLLDILATCQTFGDCYLDNKRSCGGCSPSPPDPHKRQHEDPCD